jgi:hypothetical protein
MEASTTRQHGGRLKQHRPDSLAEERAAITVAWVNIDDDDATLASCH